MNLLNPRSYDRIHMFSMVRSILIIALLGVGVSAATGQNLIDKLNRAVDGHQQRLDLIDSVRDNTVKLASDQQTAEATRLYIYTVNRIQKNINNDPNLKTLDKQRLLGDLIQVLSEFDRSNYFLYSETALRFNMITRIQELVDQKRVVAFLKSDIRTTLSVIAFFDYKPYARDVLTHCAAIEPSLLLNRFKIFAFRTYAGDVLEALCKSAPMHVSFYMGSGSLVFQVMNNVDPAKYEAIHAMLNIYKQVGSNSRAYLLLQRILNFRLTAKEADLMARDRDSLFRYLIDVRKSKDVLAHHSIDAELDYTASRRIREINDLHEESDPVRFKLCDSIVLSSEELYTMLVYGEDEVFTSSFLGVFKRLMQRMTQESSYEFLHAMGMNRYRTFIKMCAGYNTLPEFISRMSVWEKRSLFNKIVAGLHKERNPLHEAVSVADIYGSLQSQEDREIFSVSINREFEEQKWTDPIAKVLYQSLRTVLGLNGSNVEAQEDIIQLSTLSRTKLFKQDQHIQQHFFFDDTDGYSSYATFLAKFRRPGWRVVDKITYIVVESTSGRKVKIYANKPTSEYAGQDAIKAIFKSTERFPDIVVHRGHSYYVSASIESLTPNVELILLGSCGGYNNISQVLNYSPNAQIISSKQVGTSIVNNELIFRICEDIRTGKDLVWENIWASVQTNIKWNRTAVQRFADYQPPHKNLGAILIRTYRRLL